MLGTTDLEKVDVLGTEQKRLSDLQNLPGTHYGLWLTAIFQFIQSSIVSVGRQP